MRLEVQKYLFDVYGAAQLVIEFTRGQDLQDYTADAMLRSATERQLAIIGEALNRLAKIDPEVISRITDYRRIIALRNILICLRRDRFPRRMGHRAARASDVASRSRDFAEQETLLSTG